MTKLTTFMMLGAAAVLVASSACGGSSSGGTPSVTQAAKATPTLAAAATFAPTAIPGVAETAIALGPSVGLVDFTDPNGRFKMQIPDGWTLHTEKDAMSATLAGTPASAIFGVQCAMNSTVPDLIATDQSIQKQIGEGTMSLAEAHPITVAGVTGQEVPWKGALNGIAHDHWFVYFQAKACTWRIAFTTYPNVDATAMHALFLRMLDTFALT